MRAGAGYVTALVPASLALTFGVRLLEVMSVALPDVDGSFAPSGVEQVLARAERADAIVLGPGLGRAPGAFEFARCVPLFFHKSHALPMPLLPGMSVSGADG